VKLDGAKKLLKVAARAVPASPANLSFDDAPAGDKHAHAKGRHLYALVTDDYGNPVSDAKLSFSTKSGTVTPARAVSDVQGRAAVTWVPGKKGGEQTLVGMVRGSDVKGVYAATLAGHESIPRLAGEPRPTKPTSKSGSGKRGNR
jgi:hypothetical protein